VADQTEALVSTLAQRRRIERIAMDAVMARERSLGNVPVDVSARNVGYDIESRALRGALGALRLIEVKGRTAGATTVTVTRNEILTARNSPEHWYLALVEVDPELPWDAGDSLRDAVRYLQRPFERIEDPDFAVASVTFHIAELVAK
jgi:hypothetical protein